jgi:glycosyltransferase involved in cell wall biosynthesis
MKLNWFSPVAPAPTAIGQFTEHLAPALASRMEVTVWTDVEGFDPDAIPGVEIRSCRDLDRSWPEINFADFSIYNIGNDARFHSRYARMLEQHPGIVVLHDFNLHELHRERHIHESDGTAAFRRYVRRIAGREAAATVDRFNRGDISFQDCVEQVPLVRSVTRFAKGIISFNAAMEPMLRERSNAPMMFCPLPLESETRIPPKAVREFPADGPLELVMFGFLNSPNRRLDQVLEAVARYDRGPLRLTLFGVIEAREAFERQLRELHLTDKVRYLGYLDDTEMARVMEASHLAVNLRNPTRGESSNCLLQAWKFALPMLVTDTGYYATLPEGSACMVSTDNEVGDLHAHFDGFFENPGQYFQIGEAGYDYLVGNHTVEGFAENLEAYLRMCAGPYRKRFVLGYAARLGRRIEQELDHPVAVKHLQARVAADLASWIKGPPSRD